MIDCAKAQSIFEHGKMRENYGMVEIIVDRKRTKEYR